MLSDGRGELGAEFAVGQVQRPLIHQAECGGVPECRRPAIAEDDLVTIGDGEQFAQPGADAPDEVPLTGLTVGRAEQGPRPC